MNVFINDIPLILKRSNEKVYRHHYDLVLDTDDHFTSKDLVGDVLIKDADLLLIDRLVRLMEVKKLKKLSSLTLVTNKKKRLIEHLKDQFKIVKAAGGLVVKDGKILMIYRLGVWDLPKGKLNKKEGVKEGALREVEEECNISVELVEKLPKTWHSYAFKGKKILKKTSWYVMSCTDDSLMKPQAEEFIEEVRWMTPEEALEVLPKAYTSIAFIVRHYLQSLKSGKVAIFTYGFALADENFRKAGIALHCLSNYSALTEAALANGYIQESAMEALAEWRKSPETWGV